MKQKHWIYPLIFMLACMALTGCMNKEPTYESTKSEPLELIKLTSKGITDQQPADEAKEFLSHYEEVSGVRAVNHNGELLIAIDIDHEDRFSLESLEKELRKKLQKEFPQMKIDVSTDQKLLIELKSLENDITDRAISKEDIGKKLKSLRKLMKEAT